MRSFQGFPIDALLCPECQKVRIASPSGAVCPDGHGRIYLGVRQGDLDRFNVAKKHLDWLWSLPIVDDVGRSFRTQEDVHYEKFHYGDVLERVRKSADGGKLPSRLNASEASRLPEGAILARWSRFGDNDKRAVIAVRKRDGYEWVHGVATKVKTRKARAKRKSGDTMSPSGG